MRLTWVLTILFINTTISFSQNADSTSTSPIYKDTTLFSSPADTSDEFDFFYSDEEAVKYLNYKPIIGIGVGALTFYGDVRDAYYTNPILGRSAFSFSVSKGIRSYLNVDFKILTGVLSGNEVINNRNLNFRTNFLNGGVLLSYNFEHLLSKRGQILAYRKQRKLIPYLSIGFETFAYNSKADLKDANDNFYNYWSDGTIRNIPEFSAPEEQSLIVQRDHTYETDLREMDNDGLGKYAQQAFAIPIDFALELQVHQRVQLRLGATYHYSITDLTDDISTAGESPRDGKKNGDSFLYTYASLCLDIFSSEKEIEDTMQMFYLGFDFASIDFDDEDGDGVLDWDDNCYGTPEGVEVDTLGCPYDDDNDGFANYRDKELNTPKDSITNLEGVELSDEEITALSDSTDAIFYYEICDYYPSMCGKEKFRLSNEEIPQKFKFLDVNEDEYISIDEISLSIDSFFDMKSNLTIDDIYDLTEYFFSQ